MTKKTSNGSPNQAAKHQMGETTEVIVAVERNNFAAGLLLRTIVQRPENENRIRGLA